MTEKEYDEIDRLIYIATSSIHTTAVIIKDCFIANKRYGGSIKLLDAEKVTTKEELASIFKYSRVIEKFTLLASLVRAINDIHYGEFPDDRYLNLLWKDGKFDTHGLDVIMEDSDNLRSFYNKTETNVSWPRIKSMIEDAILNGTLYSSKLKRKTGVEFENMFEGLYKKLLSIADSIKESTNDRSLVDIISVLRDIKTMTQFDFIKGCRFRIETEISECVDINSEIRKIILEGNLLGPRLYLIVIDAANQAKAIGEFMNEDEYDWRNNTMVVNGAKDGLI